MVIAADAGSELLLYFFPKAKSKAWQHSGFRKHNGEIVDTKKVICRLSKWSLYYSGYTANSQSKKGTIFCCLYLYYRDNYRYHNRLDTNNQYTTSLQIHNPTDKVYKQEVTCTQ